MCRSAGFQLDEQTRGLKVLRHAKEVEDLDRVHGQRVEFAEVEVVSDAELL